MVHLYLWAVLWIWDTLAHPQAKMVSEARIAAEESFEAGQYLKAALYYKLVVEASIFSDPAGRLNMANAYFLAGEEDRAYEHYTILTRVDDPIIAAKAKSQLGRIALARQDTAAALDRFREAILLDRGNKAIIADFEILRFRFSGVVDPNGSEEGGMERVDQPAKLAVNEAPPEPAPNTAVEQSDERDQLLKNLDKINMSEEQAKSILDAMKVNERQYIYQLRRLGARSVPGQSDKPEW